MGDILYSMTIGSEEKRTWNGREYIFRVPRSNHRKEQFLQQIEDTETPISKFVKKAAVNRNLRAIGLLSYFLINPSFEPSKKHNSPTNIFLIPYMEIGDDIKDKMEKKLKNLEQEVDELEKDLSMQDEFGKEFWKEVIGSPWENFVSGLIKSATSNRYFLSAGRKDENERKRILMDLVEDRKKEEKKKIESILENFRERMANETSLFQRFYSKSQMIYIVKSILHSIERLKRAQETLSGIADPLRYNELADTLKFLRKERILEWSSVSSICADSMCDFISSYAGTEYKNNKCELCASETVQLLMGTLNKGVRTAWESGMIAEAIVGTNLARSKWVKEAVVAKNVQMKYPEGKRKGEVTKSAEVDIAIQTTTDKVVFVEVTSQVENAVERFSDKVQNLKNHGIEYDAMLQVSNSQIPHGFSLDPKAYFLPFSYLREPSEAIMNLLDREMKGFLGQNSN
jgi:hypothetical protein